MKLLFKIFLLKFLFLSSVAIANNTELSKTEGDVKYAIETFLYGASINDAQAHRNFWATDLTYTSSSGARFGWPELASGLTDQPPLEKAKVSAWYSGEDFEFKHLNNVVIVNFTLVSQPTNKNQPTERFYNTGVMVWRDNRWQALNWNATRVAPQ